MRKADTKDSFQISKNTVARPKKAFTNIFSREGRLKNKWASVTEERDPRRAMDILREVRDRLESDPEAFGHLWIDFLEDFLNASRLNFLTTADLEKLIEMGRTADKASLDVSAASFWFRVLKACDDLLDQSLGLRILTSICLGSSVSREDKIKATRELARRGATDDTHFQIYAHHLSGVPEPFREKEVFRLLQNCCGQDAAQLLRFQKKLVAKPAAFSAVWQSLFEHFVKSVEQREIAENEYQAFSEMGDLVANYPNLRLPPERIWSALADSFRKKARHDDLSGLFTRTYYALCATEAWKRRCAQELAERSVDGPRQIDLYVDYFGQVPYPLQDDTVISCLMGICLQSVERLATIHQKITKSPKACSIVLEVLLTRYFELTKTFPFSDSDLGILEQMAADLANNPSLGVSPECIWVPVSRFWHAKGQNLRLFEILSSIYAYPTCSESAKAWAARGLANKGACEFSHLHIYCDHLTRSANGPSEKRMATLLQSQCTVDFDSGDDKLESCGEIARKLITAGFEWPWVHVTHGIHDLLIEKKPLEALEHFKKASQMGGKRRTVLLGLASAWLQSGNYAGVIGLAAKIDCTKHPLFGKLSRLAASLRWLDSTTLGGAPPLHSYDIQQLDIDRYVGDCVDMALGRLLLIEGRAEEAQQVLLRLSGNRSDEKRWNYYLAWAEGLSGDGKGVVAANEAASGWSAKWTVACLASDWDSNPKQVKALESELTQEKNGYGSVLAARVAMVRSSPPPPISWKKGSGLMEEDLEALRTAMGYTFFYGRPTALTKLTQTPLFQRLPLADQFLWSGLTLLLKGDISESKRLLTEARDKFQYHRAALVLAAHFVNSGSSDQSRGLLDFVDECIKTPKIDLLRASVEVHRGRLDSAESRLNSVASLDIPLAHYGLGKLCLVKGENERKIKNAEGFRTFHSNAERSFLESLYTDDGSIPKDCQLLASCSRFVAVPEDLKVNGLGDCSAWPDAGVGRFSDDLVSWIKWNNALASLWAGNLAQVLSSFQEIEDLLAKAASVDGKLAEGIAAMLTRVFLLCCDSDESDRLMDCLVRFSLAYPSDKLKRWHDLCVAAQTRARLAQIDGDEFLVGSKIQGIQETARHNAFLSLVIGQHAIRAGSIDLAVSTFDRNQIDCFIESKLCKCLAQLSSGNAPSSDQLPEISFDDHPKLALGCSLVMAAKEFADGNSEKAYRQLAELLGSNGANLGGVISVERLLVGLCAQMVDKSGTPSSVIGLLQKLCASQELDADPSVLARCAAAIGEAEMACGMWNRAIDCDGSMESNERQLFSHYLCHLASKAALNGDILGAAERIRSAAKLTPH